MRTRTEQTLAITTTVLFAEQTPVQVQIKGRIRQTTLNPNPVQVQVEGRIRQTENRAERCREKTAAGREQLQAAVDAAELLAASVGQQRRELAELLAGNHEAK